MVLGLVSADVGYFKIVGETVDHENNPEPIDGISVYDLMDQKKLNINYEDIDYENGKFNLNNVPINDKGVVSIRIQGLCFNHEFHLFGKDNFASYSGDVSNLNDKRAIMLKNESLINLGKIKEDLPNSIQVYSDDRISLLVQDSSEEMFGKNDKFKGNTGFTNSFKPNSIYDIVLKKEDGKEWKEEIETGDYCYTTRIIKRGNKFEIDHFSPGESYELNFFKKIQIFFARFF